MNKIEPSVERDYPAPKSDQEVVDWLSKETSAERPFLLAFADDGVIWGKWVDELKLAPPEFGGMLTELRAKTLQQAFVFGEQDEVRLFRDVGGNWSACRITDEKGQDALDEIHILWGDRIIKTEKGFVHLQDAVQQGLDQLIPLDLTKAEIDKGTVPRLHIRHFVQYDEETGEARIFLSRLVKLGKGPAGKETLQ